MGYIGVLLADSYRCCVEVYCLHVKSPSSVFFMPKY
jgi:hypothetical protein